MKALAAIRRWTPVACGVLFFAVAIRSVLIESYMFAAISASIGIGLVLNKLWARRSAALLILLAAVLIPGGMFNPFTAGDFLAATGEAPSVLQILAWMIPLEVVLLGIVWLLGPQKNEAAKEER